jgi:hypothetical protein
MLIEAINQSSISTSGESIASYRLEDRNVTIEEAEVVTQTANLDLVISTDGSEKARIRSNAYTNRDRNRFMKLRAQKHIDFSGIMSAGGPTTNVRSRWNLTMRKPLVVDKRRDDIALDTAELDIEQDLHLDENLMLGTIPYNHSLLNIDPHKMFDDIIIRERDQAVIAAGGTGVIGGSEVYVPSADQQLIVLLGVMVDTGLLGAGTPDDTFLIVDRDNDPEYMKLDITAMPDNTYLNCFVPATRKLKVYLSSATGTAADGVGFIYGIRDLSVRDRIAWNLPPGSATAKMNIESLVQKYPKVYKSIKAGLM